MVVLCSETLECCSNSDAQSVIRCQSLVSFAAASPCFQLFAAVVVWRRRQVSVAMFWRVLASPSSFERVVECSVFG